MPLVGVISGHRVKDDLDPSIQHVRYEHCVLYRCKVTGKVKVRRTTRGETQTDTELKEYAPFFSLGGRGGLRHEKFKSYQKPPCECFSAQNFLEIWISPQYI